MPRLVFSTTVVVAVIVSYTFVMFQASKFLPNQKVHELENAIDLQSRRVITKPKHKTKLPTLELLTGNPKNISCPSPLVPIYDRVVDSNGNGGDVDRKIPRTIHVSHKSRCLPPDLAVAPNAWKAALPNHSFYFHDDEAVDRLFQLEFNEFPHLSNMMRCVLYKGAMRIDVWRILITYLYGGVYTDIDNVPVEGNFTELKPISTEDEFFSLGDYWNRPSQWFFAMEPKHPIGYFTMYEIFKRLQDLQSIKNPKIIFVTGPDALKSGYGNALGWPKDYLEEGIHKSKLFNKTATKISRDNNTFVKHIEFGKNITWNGENMTLRDKIERQSGVIHWPEQVKQNQFNFPGGCMQYLYLSDHDWMV